MSDWPKAGSQIRSSGSKFRRRRARSNNGPVGACNHDAPGFPHYPGDGRPDVLASRGHGKEIVWLRRLSGNRTIDTRLIGPHAITISDLDGDGDPISLYAQDSGVFAWYENDGRGGLTEHSISEDHSASEMKRADLNRDGVPDILVTGQESQNVVWFENRLRSRRMGSNGSGGAPPHGVTPPG